MTAFRTISSRRLQEDDGSSSWSTYQLTAFLVLIFVLIVAVTYSFVGTRQSRTLWYKRCFEWDWTARVELHILTRYEHNIRTNPYHEEYSYLSSLLR